VRVSDARFGHNWYAKLFSTGPGLFHCLWNSTERNSRLDLFYSASTDAGRTWIAPLRMNEDEGDASHHHRSLGYLGISRTGDPLIAWIDDREGRSRILRTFLRAQPDPHRPSTAASSPRTSSAVFEPRRVEERDTLLADSFDAIDARCWRTASGVWVVRNKTLIGYGAAESTLLTRANAFGDCSIHCRFKLDVLDHRAAYIYLRVSELQNGKRMYYRLRYYFRIGVTFEWYDGNRYAALGFVPYAIQKNAWYSTRIVASGNQLSVSINDSLVLTSNKLGMRSSGALGLGAYSVPTYFRDLIVRSVH
jgi:hypothetical protein